MKHRHVSVLKIVTATLVLCAAMIGASSCDMLGLGETGPAATNTPPPTIRIIPTWTPIPTATVRPTETPVVNTDLEGCNLDATYRDDVTIPDGTVLAAGEEFTKTWAVENSGDCAWGAGFELVWVEKTQMGDVVSVQVPEAEPGDVIQISVPLVAPATAGEYQSYWQMRVNGEVFGDKIYLMIVVE